ncbi:MAG: hypothetical protein IJU16_08205 [Clostridia bacterium]|nr:hypothetical protein [Clostridia bacterium]
MLKLRKGSVVPFPERLFEGFEVDGNTIIANVSADKIRALMERFIDDHREPLFFILELPCHRDDETEIKPGLVEALHRDVYYLDDCTGAEAREILRRFGDVLINDGLCTFGFGGHRSNDELVFGKYNETVAFSRKIERMAEMFEEHRIPWTAELVTARRTFSANHPGRSDRIETDGQTVFDIPALLEEQGLYKAERREE